MRGRTLLLALACCAAGADGALAQEPAPRDAAAGDPLPSVALPPELERVLRDYERAWEARDAAALAALFAPDGFVLRPGHPPVRGREAIEEAYRGAGGPLHLRALAFERSGPVAYVVGGYSASPDRPDGGKFVLTLRREADGRYLITADMDNGNQ